MNVHRTGVPSIPGLGSSSVIGERALSESSPGEIGDK